jgi:sugar lactone lactonase YvrE
MTYTGFYGYDVFAQAEPRPGGLILTTPEGDSEVVADDLALTNGVAISEDGSTLLVAQTLGNEITAFDRGPEGRLANRRPWATLPGINPDGVCLDAEGGLWVGSCFTNEFIRVLEGGEITHRIPTPGRWALAPMLAGPDRRTLYLLSANTDHERFAADDMAGLVEAVEADVPAAGLP